MRGRIQAHLAEQGIVVKALSTIAEIARSGSLAFDLLGGARYWFQKADLSLDVTRTLVHTFVAISASIHQDFGRPSVPSFQ